MNDLNLEHSQHLVILTFQKFPRSWLHQESFSHDRGAMGSVLFYFICQNEMPRLKQRVDLIVSSCVNLVINALKKTGFVLVK